jgi:hypothetical protein
VHRDFPITTSSRHFTVRPAFLTAALQAFTSGRSITARSALRTPGGVCRPGAEALTDDAAAESTLTARAKPDRARRTTAVAIRIILSASKSRSGWVKSRPVFPHHRGDLRLLGSGRRRTAARGRHASLRPRPGRWRPVRHWPTAMSSIPTRRRRRSAAGPVADLVGSETTAGKRN